MQWITAMSLASRSWLTQSCRESVSCQGIFKGFLLVAMCGMHFARVSHAANYPLQIIQPQPNLTTHSRFYKAYPGILYRVPVSVLGGAYPFTYSLTTAPSGMTIDAATGIISWPNPTTSGSPHSVTV